MYLYKFEWKRENAWLHRQVSLRIVVVEIEIVYTSYYCHCPCRKTDTNRNKINFPFNNGWKDRELKTQYHWWGIGWNKVILREINIFQINLIFYYQGWMKSNIIDSIRFHSNFLTLDVQIWWQNEGRRRAFATSPKKQNQSYLSLYKPQVKLVP